MTKVQKNSYGYFEIKDKPSQNEIDKYYSEVYFQSNSSSYSHKYSKEELQYIENRLEQKEIVIKKFYQNNIEDISSIKLLEIGSGEGYGLDYFSKKGMRVKGIDYSKYGCETHNPNQLSNLFVGDTYKVLDELSKNEQVFDVVIMDNLLEHILDPGKLLEQVKKILKVNGLLIIEVPNDFSELQEHLLDTQKINEEFWVVIPDHLSYFNYDGLVNLCEKYRFQKFNIFSDYPIDLNLLVESTNYINNPVGKEVNKQRIEVENYLHSKSPEKLLEIYKILAEIGLGRNLVGYFINRKLE